MSIKKRLKRYLNGNATEEDRQKLEQFFGEGDLSSIKEFIKDDWENDEDWNRKLPTELSRKMLENINQQLPPRRGHRVLLRWSMAAAAILLLTIGVGLWLFSDNDRKLQVYSTADDQWKILELPDSSVVRLNANSEIRFPKKWSAGDTREVWLEGEAFFEVEEKPATGAKFRVVTKDLKVEVLGTSFNVDSRDKYTDVFLQHGTIRLDLGEEKKIMNPGDFVSYSTDKRAIVKQQKAVPPEKHTSWKDGVKIIKDKEVAEILQIVQEIYAIEISVRNKSILTQLKTVSIPIDELDMTIPILESALRVNIVQDGNLLILE